MTGLSDSFQRPINYLRVSVTDRCNLRCVYCMPAGGVTMMSHSDILTYEEIHTVVRAAAELGISKVRITGGEPLVRLELPELVRLLTGITAIEDIALTTNGVLLGDYATELKQAGLRRINISLDTLQGDKFERITGNNKLAEVLAGVDAARSVGLSPIKLNMVVMAGINDDELLAFAARTISEGWNVRFIELMPVTSGSTAAQFVPVSEIKRRLGELGELEPCLPDVGNGPAKYFRFPGASGTVGFISPVSEHFCFRCNRLRLTADGKLRPCLLSSDEIDLRQPLRDGVPLDRLKQLIRETVARKPLRHRMAAGYVPKDRPFSQVGG